jgi:hypothetical protein
MWPSYNLVRPRPVVIMAAKRAPAAEASLGVEMAAATSAALIFDKTAPSSSPIPPVWAAPPSSSVVIPQPGLSPSL